MYDFLVEDKPYTIETPSLFLVLSIVLTCYGEFRRDFMTYRTGERKKTGLVGD